MSLIRNAAILVATFSFSVSSACKELVSLAGSEEISTCVNCPCLVEIGDYIYAGSDAADEAPGDFQSIHCNSPDLPSPGNLMVASIVGGARTNSASGGSLDNCRNQWDSIVKELFDRNYQKECSRGSATSDLLTRCDEDQYILSEFGQLMAQQSDAESQSSTQASDDCKDVAPVFSALNVFVRFENTAFLNSLIESDSIEPLIENADEDTKQALYVLTQHSENFPQVQLAILKTRKSLLNQGVGEPRDVAALADRIQIMEDGTQLYGTHTSCKFTKAILSKPVDDIEMANQRRSAIGLLTVQEFLDLASKSCVEYEELH